MMMSKFEPTLEYKGDGNLLEVCGDLDWNKDPTVQKVRVAAVIVQGNVMAAGASTEFDRGTTAEWMFEVNPNGGKFTSGPARGFGVLIVTDPHGQAPFSWDSNANGITLTPA
jgi:hypothetical protein